VGVRCRPGEAVRKGQVLFELDPATYKVLLEKAEAEVRRAQARVKRWTAEMTFARENERRKPEERGAVFVAGAQREEAEAELQSAQADRDLARLNLEGTEVKSPIDGVVRRVLVEPGETVSANAVGLTEIFSLDPLYADFYMDEITARFLGRSHGGGKMKAGVTPEIPVLISTFDDAGFARRGRLDFVDPEVQPVAETAIHCRATIPNPDRSLSPGMRIGIRLAANARHKALLVPTNSLLFEPSGQHRYVYVVDAQDWVELRAVGLGILCDGLREIVEGLKADDWVVIHRPRPIKPGEKVVVERVKSLADLR
jgi:RND family efflux transporter MFP subunit